MGEVIAYLLHNPIVRVLSVPMMMVLALYWMWRLAAPPPWEDDTHRS
ncbi:MAG TPA: hypothetical protein VJX23_14745 [Candidatus Binataceae bacterium]|nr:hypothetical protein [Candidatus Binataceae bacterium]